MTTSNYTRDRKYNPIWDNSGRVEARRPCPVCGRHDYCTFDATGYWLLCMRPDKAQGTPNGWNFVKESHTGGHLFKSDRVPGTNKYANITIADLRTSSLSPAPLLKARPVVQEVQTVGSGDKAFCSDLAARHAVYSDLLAALTISPRHLQELLDPKGKRQLTPAEVKAMGVKSLPGSWPEINRILEQLRRKHGKATLCSVPGFYLDEAGRFHLAAGLGTMLLPVVADGLITGLRARHDAGGYYWLSSARHGGPGARMQTSVYIPLPGVIPAEPGRVGITEGEFKAFIAAQRLGYPFISVPGVGNWQSAGAVEEARCLAGPGGLVTVFYDSDAATNHQVSFHKYALADALVKAGMRVELAEWDLQYKGIDDLLLAGGTGSFKTFCHLPGLNGLRVDDLLDVPRLDYIPIDYNRAITLIRSAKGTGKTYWLSKEIEKVLARRGRVLVIGHRVALLKEACDRHNLEFYQDFRGARFSQERQDNRDMSKVKALAITLDSLPRLNTTVIDKVDLLVIDESEQALLHMTGTTVRDKRSSVMSHLRYLIGLAKKVIFLDADMSAISYNYLAGIKGADQIQVIVNAHKPAQKTFIRYSKVAAVHDLIKTRLAAGEKLFITSNSRQAVKTLAQMLENLFPDLRGWVIHSEKISKEEQEKIANINQVVENYDYVIASPTLGTGISIDVEYFDTVVLLAEANLTTHLDLMQQAARVRQPKSGQVHCWVANRKMQLSTNPQQIKEWAVKNIEETGIAVEIDTETRRRVAGRQEQEYLNLLADIYAARNSSWTDFRTNFWQQVELEGHRVQMAGDDLSVKGQYSEVSEAYREARLELKDKRAAGVLAASDISTTTYKTLKEKTYLQEEERLQLQRHSLQQFYGPDLPVDAGLIEDDNEARIRPKLVNWLAASEPGFSLERDKVEITGQFNRDHRLLGDLKHLHLKTELRKEILIEAGLLDDQGELFKVFNAGILRARGFDKWAAANQERIERWLGIKVKSEQSLVRLVTSTLSQLGLEPECRQYRTGEKYEDPETGRIKEVRDREYWLSKKQFRRVQELALAHLATLKTNNAAREEENPGGWRLSA
jgi:hypothetical protein